MFPYATQTYGRGIPRHSAAHSGGQLMPTAEEDQILKALSAEANDLVITPSVVETASAQPLAGTSSASPAQVPTIEPANWDDALANTDVEIPATVVVPTHSTRAATPTSGALSTWCSSVTTS